MGATWTVDAVRVSGSEDRKPPRFAVAPPMSPIRTIRMMERFHLPVLTGKPSSHASSLTAVTAADGTPIMLAFWYAGTRESAPDVEIVSSRFDTRRRRWSQPVVVVNRHQLAEELDFGVRRLGNPVAWTDPDGDVHLFVVATGAGGWAASRVVHLVSKWPAWRFIPLRVLPLSPWFNTSSLVRAPATALADGGALLPLHFEVGNKYPLVLRLSDEGEPIDLVRMADDDEALQPSIVPLDERRAVALVRDHGETRTLKMLATLDGGDTWEDPVPTNVRNPNSAVVAIRLPDGTLAAIVNPTERGRNRLVLKRSDSGRTWDMVALLAEGSREEEYSYPSALVVGNELHVTYTSRRTSIEHQVFVLE